MIYCGASRDEAFYSAPKEIWCYEDAQKLRDRANDVCAYQQGFYNYTAFNTVMYNAFKGKGKKAETYPIEPLFTSDHIVEETEDAKRQRMLEEYVREKKRNKLNFDLWKMEQK